MSFDRYPVKVLIADDHPIVVVALTEMLSAALGEDGMLVDSVADGDCLLRRLENETWNYLVLDLHMPGRLKSMSLLREVLARQPQLQTLIYTGIDQPFLALAALELGARAFVLKSCSSEIVITAIRSVMAGQNYVDPSIDLAEAKRHPWHQLTTGERAVLLALARGENLQAIAIDSGRSYKTVTAHKYNALRKLGLKSNDEIGHYLERLGLVHSL